MTAPKQSSVLAALSEGSGLQSQAGTELDSPGTGTFSPSFVSTMQNGCAHILPNAVPSHKSATTVKHGSHNHHPSRKHTNDKIPVCYFGDYNTHQIIRGIPVITLFTEPFLLAFDLPNAALYKIQITIFHGVTISSMLSPVDWFFQACSARRRHQRTNPNASGLPLVTQGTETLNPTFSTFLFRCWQVYVSLNKDLACRVMAFHLGSSNRHQMLQCSHRRVPINRNTSWCQQQCYRKAKLSILMTIFHRGEECSLHLVHQHCMSVFIIMITK